MNDSKVLRQDVPLWSDGNVLTAIAFILIGTILCCQGLLKLKEIWVQVQPFFPLSLPRNISQIIAHSMHIILDIFISAIASLCAILMGSVWAFSGLVDLVRSRKGKSLPDNLARPECIAESLISAKPIYSKSFSLFWRFYVRLLPQLVYMSPLRHQMVGEAIRGALKTGVLIVLVSVAINIVNSVPNFVDKYLHVKITFSVPSLTPLYCLLFLVALCHIVIAVSLVPVKERLYSRNLRTVRFQGTGDPNLFLALFEESLKDLPRNRHPLSRPTRLGREGGEPQIGTLMEDFPQICRTRSLPAGYFSLLVMVISILIGFFLLMGFHHQALVSGELTEFLSRQGLEYVMDVCLALALILTGTHFATWAERLLNIRKYKSAIVFCTIVMARNSQILDAESQTKNAREHPSTWQTLHEVDECFVQWAEHQKELQFFLSQIFWAEMISESARKKQLRHMIGLQTSDDLDRYIGQVIDIPFCVNFEKASTEKPL